MIEISIYKTTVSTGGGSIVYERNSVLTVQPNLRYSMLALLCFVYFSQLVGGFRPQRAL